MFFILGYFLPFYPLTARKIKIFRKWKMCLEVSCFYTCVPKIMISWRTVPEIWCTTDGGMDQRTEGWTDGQTDRWTDGGTNEQTDRQTDGRADGQMDILTEKVTYRDGCPNAYLMAFKRKWNKTSQKKPVEFFQHWNQQATVHSVLEIRLEFRDQF